MIGLYYHIFRSFFTKRGKKRKSLPAYFEEEVINLKTFPSKNEFSFKNLPNVNEEEVRPPEGSNAEHPLGLTFDRLFQNIKPDHQSTTRMGNPHTFAPDSVDESRIMPILMQAISQHSLPSDHSFN